jgi:hypothetical protein
VTRSAGILAAMNLSLLDTKISKAEEEEEGIVKFKCIAENVI